MAKPGKQLKITKLFKKTATKVTDDSDELQEEVRQLEQQLREKQDELFQIQRSQLRKKASLPKKKEDSFIRPERIILNNSIDSYKRNLELISMLTGVEVQSFEPGEHCCVVFHMQHVSDHVVKHGLKIDMASGKTEITGMSLPLGFNLSGVMDGFNNVMEKGCLCAIRRALMAYYDRLDQFEQLKKLLNIEAQLFKTLDGSHMQIALFIKGDDEEEDHFPLTLMLDYRVYDIRPKNYSIKAVDLPEGAAEVIREQCAVFKEKPLRKAFKKAFAGDGEYKLVKQIVPRPAEKRALPRKRFRPNKHQYNDDTFQPEDCSDDDEEDDDEDDDQ